MSSKEMVDNKEDIIAIIEKGKSILTNTEMWVLFKAYNKANLTDFNEGAMACSDCRREVYLYWANKVNEWKKVK